MNNSKHKAKRLSVALLIAVLAVSTSFASVMTGCGNKDESSSTAATVASTASAAENTTVANDKSESELNTESSTQSSSSNSTANSSQTSENPNRTVLPILQKPNQSQKVPKTMHQAKMAQAKMTQARMTRAINLPIHFLLTVTITKKAIP